MVDWSRREFVRSCGAAIGVGCLPSATWAMGARGGGARATRVHELVRLGDRLARLPRIEALDAGVRELADGRPWDELLGAVFFAGLRHVRPRPVGFKLHCVFVVESMFQLAAGSPERGARAAMWNLADLKASQARDVAEGDWELPVAPETSTRSK